MGAGCELFLAQLFEREKAHTPKQNNLFAFQAFTVANSKKNSFWEALSKHLMPNTSVLFDYKSSSKI